MSERSDFSVSSQPKRSNRMLALLLIGAGITILLYSSGILSGAVWSVVWPVVLVALGLDLVTEGRQRRKIVAGALLVAVICIPIVNSTWLFGGDWLRFGYLGNRTVEFDDIDRLQTKIALNAGNVSIDDFRGPGAHVVELEDRAEVTRQAKEGSTGILEVGARSGGWWREQDVEVQFRRDLPLDLTVEIGAGEAKTLDFQDLQLENLNLVVGLGDTDLKLPARGIIKASITSAGGNVKIEVPDSMAVRIEVKGSVGEVDLGDRFRKDGNAYVSTNYSDDAPNRATIQILDMGGKLEVK